MKNGNHISNEVITFYDEDKSSIFQKYTVINGDFQGKFLQYYKSGTLETKSNYENGKLDGEKIYYNNDGNVMVISNKKRKPKKRY
jgi:antitoxin component YwqK of YwqJK toxin-antitoxin module